VKSQTAQMDDSDGYTIDDLDYYPFHSKPLSYIFLKGHKVRNLTLRTPKLVVNLFRWNCLFLFLSTKSAGNESLQC
jgi:hypothetical protein